MPKLMTCKSCDAQISTQAATCPHCGHVYQRTFYQQYRRNQTGCLVILLVIGLAILIYSSIHQ
jgi:uncharacterized paraquat-inducible protein A